MGTVYNPTNLAPETDDNEVVLARKIGAMLFANATGDLPTSAPQVDDDFKAVLYKIAALLYACEQGDAQINQP
jgi:hypothetical protein